MRAPPIATQGRRAPPPAATGTEPAEARGARRRGWTATKQASLERVLNNVGQHQVQDSGAGERGTKHIFARRGLCLCEAATLYIVHCTAVAASRRSCDTARTHLLTSVCCLISRVAIVSQIQARTCYFCTVQRQHWYSNTIQQTMNNSSINNRRHVCSWWKQYAAITPDSRPARGRAGIFF